LKIKEYLLSNSSFESESDLDIVFKDLEWGKQFGRTWVEIRNSFLKNSNDYMGITITADSPSVYWRAYLTRGLSNCIFYEETPIIHQDIGLISIRVHLEESSASKYEDFLSGLGFIEDDPGYWSTNIWSE
jgi:hypothetical protein